MTADVAVRIGYLSEFDVINTETKVVLMRENSGKPTKHLKVKSFGAGSRRRGLHVVLDADTLRSGTMIDEGKKPSFWKAIRLLTMQAPSALQFAFAIQINGKRHTLDGEMQIPKDSFRRRFGRGLKQFLKGSSDYYFEGRDGEGRRITFHFKSQTARRTEKEDTYQLQAIHLYLPDNWDSLYDTTPAREFWDLTLPPMKSVTSLNYDDDDEMTPIVPPRDDDDEALASSPRDVPEAPPLPPMESRARIMALGRYLGELNQQDVAAEITHHCNANMDAEHYRTAELPKPIQQAIRQYLL